MAHTMDIYWHGQAHFKLKGKNTTVVIDPYDSEFTGLKLAKDLTADVVLSTHEHQDHNNTASVKGTAQASPMIFKQPGEYEVSSIIITGISSFHDDTQGSERGLNIIFHIMMDGLNIVHLGDLGQSKLTEEQIVQISETDILLIPVGGIYTIDGKQASDIVAQLEPRIIIPMHYFIDGLKFQLDTVDKFLKEMGVEGVTPQPKLSITKEKLPEEPMVVLLSKS